MSQQGERDTLELTMEAAPVLAALDKLLAHDLREVVTRAVERARSMLTHTREPFGWAIIDVTGVQLPAGIRSAWVFVIDAQARPEPHRHPNSVQHLRSLSGVGRVVLSRRDSPIRGGFVLDEAHPWLIIAEDVIHDVQPVSPMEWVVASFHTVAAAELVEITASGARHYV